MRTLLVCCAVLFHGAVFAEDCANQTVINRVTDQNGNTFVAEQATTSCGNLAPNLQKFIGVDRQCYTVANSTNMVCYNNSGKKVWIGDVATFDVLSHPTYSASSVQSSNQQYINNPQHAVEYFGNFLKWNAGRLDSETANLHSNAIRHALETSNNGEVLTWTNPKNTAAGQIKIVKTAINGPYVCRTLLVQVTTKAGSRDYTEDACFNTATNQWHFVKQ